MSDGTHIPQVLEVSREDWGNLWEAYQDGDDEALEYWGWLTFRLPLPLIKRYLRAYQYVSEVKTSRKSVERQIIELGSNARYLSIFDVRRCLRALHEFAEKASRQGLWGPGNRLPDIREAEAHHLVWCLLRSKGYSAYQVHKMAGDRIVAVVMWAAVPRPEAVTFGPE